MLRSYFAYLIFGGAFYLFLFAGDVATLFSTVIKSASEPSSQVATSQVAKSQAHQNTSTGLVALNPSPFRKRTLLQEQDDSEEANEKINL